LYYKTNLSLNSLKSLRSHRSLRSFRSFKELFFYCEIPLFAAVSCFFAFPLSAPAATPTPPSNFPIQFTDVTRSSGISFKHNNGAFGKKYLPETMGAGCAFLDYNNDGWQDILFINGMDFPGHKRQTSYPALYRNNRNGTFTDVTREAGLAVELYGNGVAIGDFDNDGNADIFISALGSGRLFRNLGNGKFQDVTQKAGLSLTDYGTSCAWLDYDRDGYLDLFICNYVRWSAEGDIYCTLDGRAKSYCTPESYKGVSNRLFRNLHNGTFQDVTRAAGLSDPTSKSLGVAVSDFNRDGWPDLLVANDTQPNKLYLNHRNGTFTEKGVTAGIAFSEEGTARGAMGVDAADYDGSGFPSLLIGNFSNQMLNLYHNEGNGLFIDEAPASSVGQASLLTLAFGCLFLDADLDGRPDLFVANGHVEDDINRVQKRVTFAQPPLLFLNRGNHQFEEVARQSGSGFSSPKVARGAAFGDFNNDGNPDLLLTTNNGPACLYRNEGGTRNHFLVIQTVGTRSNRSGIGALVRLKYPDKSTHWQIVKSGSSYCSQSQLPLIFGLGNFDRVLGVEIEWPSGQVDRWGEIRANQRLRAREGSPLEPIRP
jgi:enediyne biosynthesis protein E4